ncbi:MAG: O-antigen ligase family protein [Proteobacteria bacterium]|nr:O-antigen ligase family protein [Pseudomonadota bacterium]
MYLALFVSAVLGSILFNPLIGISGYLITYHINPLTHWWGAYIPASINRYSLILAVATFIGMVLHKSKLKFMRMVEAQEILLILFVGLCWLSIPLGVASEGIDEHLIKITKIAIMAMMASHLITDIRRYEMIVYIFIFTGLFLGIETYNAPTWYFAGGRLGGGVGGSDLSNGNMLAAHFIMVLALVGVMFIKGGWKTKLLCSASAVFMLNGIVLIQSRGAFLSLLAGAMSAVVFTKKVSRKKIIICVLAGIIGGATLADTGFWERIKLIQFDTEKMESSSRSRVELWKISIDMAWDYPLGVGVENYKKVVAQYDYSLEGLEPHNTYLRCLTDIGFQGLLVLLLLIANAFRILSSISKDIDQLENKEIFSWHIYGVKIGLIAYLTAVFFVSATYTEDFYWFLMFPVFLKRAVENEINQTVSNNAAAIHSNEIVNISR